MKAKPIVIYGDPEVIGCIHINQMLFDKEHNCNVWVTDVTSSSVQIEHKALSKSGIDCKQWYSVDGKQFKNRFVI